jgi:hypothetical protein
MKPEKQTLTKSDIGKIDATTLLSTKATAPPTPGEVKAAMGKALDKATETAEPPKQEAAPAPVLIKVLKADPKFRGAREAWFKRLVEFDGKPVDDYIASCKEKCPQLTKNGTAENPTGWVGFFKREGIAQFAPKS